jgi:hypothetical protein
VANILFLNKIRVSKFKFNNFGLSMATKRPPSKRPRYQREGGLVHPGHEFRGKIKKS